MSSSWFAHENQLDFLPATKVPNVLYNEDWKVICIVIVACTCEIRTKSCVHVWFCLKHLKSAVLTCLHFLIPNMFYVATPVYPVLSFALYFMCPTGAQTKQLTRLKIIDHAWDFYIKYAYLQIDWSCWFVPSFQQLTIRFLMTSCTIHVYFPGSTQLSVLGAMDSWAGPGNEAMCVCVCDI